MVHIHKKEKYKTARSLKLQEVRVDSWSLADRLLGLYIEGASFEGLGNPYGDGRACERIVRSLAEAPVREVLLHKRALLLDTSGSHFVQKHEDSARPF